MKTRIFMLAIALLILGSFTAVFAAEKIPAGQTNSASNYSYVPVMGSSDEMLKAVKQTKAGVNALKKTTGELVAAQGKTEKAVTSLAGSVSDLTTEVGKTNGKIDTAKTEIVTAVKNSNERFQDQNVVNTFILVCICVLGFILLALFVNYLSKRTGKEITGQTDKILKGTEEIVKDLPKKTADLINEFDASPIVIKIAGVEVGVYHLSEEEIEGKFYATLQIEDEGDGKPENFIRQMKSKRGVAIRYISGVVKNFRDGKLTGTPQEKLIGYLRGKGTLKIS